MLLCECRPPDLLQLTRAGMQHNIRPLPPEPSAVACRFAELLANTSAAVVNPVKERVAGITGGTTPLLPGLRARAACPISPRSAALNFSKVANACGTSVANPPLLPTHTWPVALLLPAHSRSAARCCNPCFPTGTHIQEMHVVPTNFLEARP
jgi:hypothetical protein